MILSVKILIILERFPGTTAFWTRGTLLRVQDQKLLMQWSSWKLSIVLYWVVLLSRCTATTGGYEFCCQYNNSLPVFHLHVCFPLQNNVLELWSLFDFLMPGFLGTERQVDWYLHNLECNTIIYFHHLLPCCNLKYISAI